MIPAARLTWNRTPQLAPQVPANPIHPGIPRPETARRLRSATSSTTERLPVLALALRPRSRAQQSRHLDDRVRRVEQDDAELVPADPAGDHVAATGRRRVAGLDAGDPRRPVEDEWIVVPEVEVVVLDREREVRVPLGDDVGDPGV